MVFVADDGEESVVGACKAVEGGVFVEVGVHAVEFVVVGWVGQEDFVGGDADYGALRVGVSRSYNKYSGIYIEYKEKEND